MVFASFSDSFKYFHTADTFAAVVRASIWSRHVIVRYNLFGLFRLFGRTPKEFFCYFRPNNFGCRTFGASLVFFSFVSFQSCLVFSSHLFSSSFVSSFLVSVLLTLLSPLRAFSSCLLSSHFVLPFITSSLLSLLLSSLHYLILLYLSLLNRLHVFSYFVLFLSFLLLLPLFFQFPVSCPLVLFSLLLLCLMLSLLNSDFLSHFLTHLLLSQSHSSWPCLVSCFLFPSPLLVSTSLFSFCLFSYSLTSSNSFWPLSFLFCHCLCVPFFHICHLLSFSYRLSFSSCLVYFISIHLTLLSSCVLLFILYLSVLLYSCHSCSSFSLISSTFLFVCLFSAHSSLVLCCLFYMSVPLILDSSH